MSVPPLPTLADCPPDGPARDSARSSLTAYLQSLSHQPLSSSLLDFLGQSEPVDHEPTPDEATKRANDIADALDQFREDLIAPGGMAKLFNTIIASSDINDLPKHHQLVIEWWRVWYTPLLLITIPPKVADTIYYSGAAALYRTLVEHVRSPEHLRRLKIFHKRAPYGSWAAILKGTNPVTIVKAVANILLARPFGSHCLLQNMLVSTIDDEAHATIDEIGQVETLLGDPGRAFRAKSIVVDAPLGGYDAGK